MPFGLAKTGLTFYSAPAGGGGVSAALYQEDLTTDVVSNEQFQNGNHAKFAGFNSSGDPVFVVVYTESGRNNIYTLLYSIQLSDGTVTTGTKYTVATGSANLIYPAVATEKDDANMRQDVGSVGNYAVFVWRNLSTDEMNGRAASYDLDALTMSFGSATNFNSDFPSRGQTNIVFGGNSQTTLVVNRTGPNNTVPQVGKVYRSGTTLSTGVVGKDTQALGGYEFAEYLGFKQDRFFMCASANNRDRVRTHYGYWYGVGDTVAFSETDIQEGNETDTRSASAAFNATDSYINIRYETQQTPTNTQVEGGVITWNSGGTVPTLTQTNQIELDSVAQLRLGVCNGAVDNVSYAFHYSGTGNDLDLHKISLSGTTITKDYTKTLSLTTLPNETPLTDNTMIEDSNGDSVLVIYGRNSSNGYPMITYVVNPDDL